MNRQDLLGMEDRGARRMVAVEPVEFRDAEDGTLQFDGYASVTEYSYPVYGGPPYGWNETIARGAFKRTLAEGADVNFLINHEGITLARTKSGTLTLLEDKTGLRALADLDPDNPEVMKLRSALGRGDVDEMSFGFRVRKDQWFDEKGEPSNKAVGTQRRILDVNLHKGDVSAVNYGANDATSGSFRGITRAFTELEAGRPLTNEQRALICSLADSIRAAERTPEPSVTLSALSRYWEQRTVA